VVTLRIERKNMKPVKLVNPKRMTYWVPINLKESFEYEVLKNDSDASTVLRELMKAYIELSERANGQRLPRLDLCGFEDEGKKGSIYPISPSLLRVAERQPGYHSAKTDQTPSKNYALAKKAR
jgi:hypothetical protein